MNFRCCSLLVPKFRLALVAVVGVLIWCCELNAQQSPLRYRAAPESCLLFSSWEGFGSLDPNRSESEKWLNQKEMILFGQKVEKAIFQAIDFHLSKEKMDSGLPKMAATAGGHLLVSFVKKPGSFYIEEFQPDKKIPARFGAHIDLGDRFELMNGLLKGIAKELAKEPGVRVSSASAGGQSFYKLELDQFPIPMYWNLSEGHLHVVSDPKVLEAWNERSRTPVPSWLRSIQKDFPNGHINSISFVNFQKLLRDTQHRIPEDVKAGAKKLGLDQLKDLVITTALNKEGTIVEGRLGFQSPDVPMIGFLPKVGWKEDELARVRKSQHLVAGAKVDFRKLMDFINLASEVSGQSNVMKDMFEDASRQGFDLESLGESIGPGILIHGNLSLIPMMSVAISVDINDPEKFQVQYDKVLNDIQKAAEVSDDLPEASRPEIVKRNGYTMASIVSPGGGRLYFSQNGERLAISGSSRLVAKVLKNKPAKEKITDLTFMKNVFGNKFKKRGSPFAITSFDSVPGVKTALPGLQVLMPLDQPIPGTDIALRDIPSADTIVNGWKPTVSAFYRTEKGLEFTSQMTAPTFSPGVTVGFMTGLLLPAVQQARDAARRVASMNNVKQQLLALHMYHDTYRTFPTQYSLGKDGKPLLSWRVHILQFTDFALYEKFRLNEPWDSQHNKELIAEMPDYYADPRFATEDGKTVYLGVTGKAGSFVVPSKESKNRGNRLRDFVDGTSNTVSIVQVDPEHAVIWTAPEDFNYSRKGEKEKLQWGRYSTKIVGLADGSTRSFNHKLSWETFKKMFTIDGRDIFEFYDE